MKTGPMNVVPNETWMPSLVSTLVFKTTRTHAHAMQITFLYDSDADSKMRCFVHDKDVLRVLFHATNELNILSASNEKIARERRAWYEPFTQTAHFSARCTGSRHIAHTNAKLGILKAVTRRVGTRP